MDLCYAGQLKHKCYSVRRDPKGVRGQMVPAGRCTFTPAVELGLSLQQRTDAIKSRQATAAAIREEGVIFRPITLLKRGKSTHFSCLCARLITGSTVKQCNMKRQFTNRFSEILKLKLVSFLDFGNLKRYSEKFPVRPTTYEYYLKSYGIVFFLKLNFPLFLCWRNFYTSIFESCWSILWLQIWVRHYQKSQNCLPYY
jgi:hypothetical protein